MAAWGRRFRDLCEAHIGDLGGAGSRKGHKVKTKNLTKPYEPTLHERAAAKACFARKQKTLPSPRMKVSTKGGVATISPDHPEAGIGHLLLMETLGTTDPDFIDGLLVQLANAATKGRVVDERGLNFMLAVVTGIEPKDQVEAMLAAQMAAVHNATMTLARRLAHVDNIPQQDSAERAFNKLARTFAAQVSALKEYRSKGEQKMIVQHVNVSDGGQAVIGTVNSSRREADEKTGEQQYDIGYAQSAQMPSAVETERAAVPRAGSSRT
jgi:hypothetical protein